MWEEKEGDDLGYYDDGVKRTLTDEQIEMFRHSELEQVARAERLAREELGLDDEAAPSPRSDASSLDEDLVGLSRPHKHPKHPHSLLTAASRSKTRTLPVDAFSSSKRSTSTASADNRSGRQMKKQRKEDIPYDQRNKRKWEEHIATVDPVKGTWMYESKTENRLRREADNIKAESVELDY